MGFNQSYFNGNSKYPVEPILQFEDFLQKVNAASSRSGFFYRLPPIGDEWEYIIRGGPSPKTQIQYNHYFARSKNDLPSILNNDLSFTQANFDGNCPQGAGK